MKIVAKLLAVTTILAGSAVAGPALTADKTLVSWVSLANTTQQGGSALTIQSGDRFDGIVFGERVAVKWMAGSYADGAQPADFAITRDVPVSAGTPHKAQLAPGGGLLLRLRKQ
jgi:hypothetical protein